MTIIRNTEDFRREFGPGPTLPHVDPAERLRQLGIENLPHRLRWLAMHPRLLALAYFIRPSRQPDLRMYRIVAAEQTAANDARANELFTQVAAKYPDFAEAAKAVAGIGFSVKDFEKG